MTKRLMTVFVSFLTVCFMAGTLFSGTAYAEKKLYGKVKMTPFTNVARINGVRGPGGIDYVASDDKAKAIATAIATYVAVTDESGAIGTETNWVLGGLEGEATEEAIEEAILRVPTAQPIDPDLPMSSTNRKKVNVIELCNRTFAQKAMGLAPIIEGDDTTKIVNGKIHAPALPCEVSVYTEGSQIYVDMLNPEAIFTLFFTDVLFGPQMQDPDFAAALQSLPAVVNEEIKSIIYAALEEYGFRYTAMDKDLGPRYQWLDDVVEVVDAAPYDSPFVHFAYTKMDGTAFTGEELATIAQTIVDTLSLDGIHDPALDAQLNSTDWRSARPNPLPIPGNQVIEACSPANAINAMSLGLDHATALPCEIALTLMDDNNTLLVSYLDPHFMFGALFNDAFNQLSKEELEEFMSLPPEVLADLQTIVQYTFDNYVGGLNPPTQMFYNMLPQ